MNLACGVKFQYGHWNITQQLSITGERDSLYNTNKRMTYIRIRADQTFAHEAWNYATIPDIGVFLYIYLKYLNILVIWTGLHATFGSVYSYRYSIRIRCI